MLSDEEKIELARFVDSNLYKRAKEAVLSLSSTPVSSLLVTGLNAPEAGIIMAIEKGAAAAFTQLERLSRPTVEQLPAPTYKPIIRNKS